MSTTHTLAASFEVQSASTAPSGPCIFEGWASVFGVRIDAHVPTIIDPGAFTKTLSTQLHRIKVLWQHDMDEPIGRPLELRETARGLFMRAKLSNTARGLEAAQLLRDGVLTELSIGFDAVSFYMNTSGREPVRHITEAQLWEISLVSLAANPEARVTTVHRRDRMNAVARGEAYREWQVRAMKLNLLRASVTGRLPQPVDRRMVALNRMARSLRDSRMRALKVDLLDASLGRRTR